MSTLRGRKGDGVEYQEVVRKQMWERRGLEVKDYRDGNEGKMEQGVYMDDNEGNGEGDGDHKLEGQNSLDQWLMSQQALDELKKSGLTQRFWWIGEI